MPVIYKITYPTNKIYIGQSWNVKHRLERYRSMDCAGQVKLYSSILKHGWDKHIFEIVHELPEDTEQEIINQYELLYWQFYIDHNFDMMNVRYPGSNGKLSEETKKLISEKNKGKKRSPEQVEKNRLSRIGHKSSDETKKKMSEKFTGSNNPFYGKKHSEETLKKLRDKKLGVKRGPHSEEHRRKISEAHKIKKIKQ